MADRAQPNPLARLLRRAAIVLLGMVPALPALAAVTPCADEAPAALALTPDPAEAAVARQTLQALLLQARTRSQSVGAARLLAEAAQNDVEEARAAPLPRVTLGAGASVVDQRLAYLRNEGTQGQVGLSLSTTLFDSGRTEALVGWRERLLEAARLNELDQGEQVALQTVSLALEQQRYRRQAEVYGRYVARMGCLVNALERVVAADRGRASELLQARNTLRQAHLSLALTTSVQRQIETRLRRLVGESLAPPAPLELLLSEPPALETALDEAAHASAIAQLSAQAEAQDNLARAVRAASKPQLSLSVSGSRTAGMGPATTWSGSLNLNVPLVDLAAAPAQRAARPRAAAARLQRDDALSSRLQRVNEIHEQARLAFERARASVDVLQGSQRLREITLLQWQQLGRRSLFDVISTESEFHNLLITRFNALLDGQQAVLQLWSLGRGVEAGLQ